jgi:hypothetical protein
LVVWLAFWYGRRSAGSAVKNKKHTPDEDLVQKAELEAEISRAVEIGETLSEEEKRELERLRAAELDSDSPRVAAGGANERAELEARRREVFEMS